MNWPAHFLAEELWLRGRRSLLLGLEHEGFKTSEEEYQTYMAEQLILGQSILRRLTKSFGAEDYSYLVSQLIFGPANRRFSLRLPFILAFGHQCSSHLQRIYDGKPVDLDFVLDLSALFNLGISLFDHMTDRPAIYGDILQLMSDQRLNTLLTDASASIDLTADLKQIDVPEIKVFGRLLSIFFSGAHKLRATAIGRSIWADFVSHILLAYHDQLNSAPSGAALYKPCIDGRNKSVEPFIIIAFLVMLAATQKREYNLVGFAEEIGEVFWRVDDLADLGRDLYTHQANCILARLENEGDTIGLNDGRKLAEVLRSDYIEIVVSETITHLKATLNLIERYRTSPGVRENFIRWFITYIVDWLR